MPVFLSIRHHHICTKQIKGSQPLDSLAENDLQLMVGRNGNSTRHENGLCRTSTGRPICIKFVVQTQGNCTSLQINYHVRRPLS